MGLSESSERSLWLGLGDFLYLVRGFYNCSKVIWLGWYPFVEPSGTILEIEWCLGKSCWFILLIQNNILRAEMENLAGKQENTEEVTRHVTQIQKLQNNSDGEGLQRRCWKFVSFSSVASCLLFSVVWVVVWLREKYVLLLPNLLI